MKFRWVAGLTCALMLSAMVWVRAADSSGAAPHKPRSNARLTQPWSKMTDLSDEQKSKIREIHAKANEDIRAIHQKENEDIMALLSDDQKAEVKKLIEEQTASRKRRGNGGASTKPSAEGAAAPAGQ